MIENLLKLFALDIYMLQKDRGIANIQFQYNLKNEYFDLAPIYDCANCIDVIGKEGIYIPNAILTLDENAILMLIKHYPKFLTYLEILLNQKMSDIFEQICKDYHFNQNCFAYEQIKVHYQIKEESHKPYWKQYIKK